LDVSKQKQGEPGKGKRGVEMEKGETRKQGNLTKKTQETRLGMESPDAERRNTRGTSGGNKGGGDRGKSRAGSRGRGERGGGSY